ncbi:hypothetical protein POPTR_015G136300v4 [Populus trichocarpa]|uniref:AP2/ERF domain-containing protein n=2 Tax=Populus trichocarpa TaxID=3694 RepID=B9ID12_POPTR|nr:ethylene-responsive transcription factor ERF027 [Populus trichocarpa]KAI5563417.1 hypothetical protein BDE02_15G117000 [Populus trichocarpa]PNT02011.1 hypothetical protein POPTR_015G136300v4 [Populus trichocarpa]|eukprot:XP_002321876.1 ethylene-responsive transcription factor ERF027 [Populus trichocarpa]
MANPKPQADQLPPLHSPILIPSPIRSSGQPFSSRHDEHPPRLIRSPIGFSSQPMSGRHGDQSPRRPIRPPGGSSAQPASGRHPTFKGVRLRSGKWVSEIREPRKTTRVWLGTYPTPEMAATAYDVAALALKGTNTPLNFPESILSYPTPASASPGDIRAAAASAASARSPKRESGPNPEMGQPETEGSSSIITADVQSGQEIFDEEELLNMPNLLVDMAGGMLVSPPRINTLSSDDSPGSSDAESLWSYH